MIFIISYLLYLGGGIAVVIAAILTYFAYSHTFWLRKRVFSPPSNLIYGHFKKVVDIKAPIGVHLKSFYDKYKPEGHKFLGLYTFHHPFFLVMDPTLIKTILTQHFEYFTDRDLYSNEESDPLSAHLFSLTGQKWRKLRQKLTPTFTTGKIKQMFPTLLACSNELSNCLNEKVEKGEPIDIKNYYVQYTTDVIGSCAFGIDCNSFKNPNSEFLKYTKQMFKPNFFDRLKIIFGGIYPDIAKFIKLRIINSAVHNFFMNLVHDTVKYREDNNFSRNDFLQLLIQLKNKGKVEDSEGKQVDDGTKLTVNQIAAQCFIFYIAGFETSSTTLTFCTYELAKKIDIQEKTRNEIMKVLAKYNGNITYDALSQMVYTERVILETLRKHPPVMQLRRKVTKDYIVPGTKILLKKNTIVIIPILGVQYDDEYYPDPEKFDPDRFTEENKATRPDFTWLPFGDGPRICIGMRFGLLQTKVALCRVLMNYKFTLNPKTMEPIETDPNSLMKSVKGGVWVNAERIGQ